MHEPIELVPDAASYRNGARLLPSVLTAVLACVAISFIGGWAVGLIPLLTLGIILFWVWRFFARARITLDEDSLRYRRAFSETFLPTADVGTVVFVPELEYMERRLNSLIAVTNTRGRGRVVMTAPFWTTHQMRHLSAAIDAPVDVLGPSRIGDVQRRYPRALPLYLGRPVVLTLSVIVALVVAIVAFDGLTRLIHAYF